MPGLLRTRNRKVKWNAPRYIKGVPYYPIEGARSGFDEFGAEWKEYATMNGNIVVITDHHGLGPGYVQSFSTDEDQRTMELLYPDFAEGFVIDHTYGETHGERFADRRFIPGNDNIWVKFADFTWRDGQWVADGRRSHHIVNDRMTYKSGSPTYEEYDDLGRPVCQVELTEFKGTHRAKVTEICYEESLRESFAGTPVSPPTVTPEGYRCPVS